MKTSRRNFIAKSLLASAALTGSIGKGHSATMENPNASTPASAGPGAFTINIFSKTLHWLDYQQMAEAAAEMGFDGIDLTVRPEGHVLPERVAEDLPRAFDAIKKAGLNIYMITTAINRADDPFTIPILKTAASLRIPYYRMGWIPYDEKKSIEDNLKIFKDEMTKLAALNKTYGIHGDYQNHSGMSFGSPVWDLWTILKDLDPQWIGSQYDVLHATVEGANSWPLGLRLLKSYIRTMDIKDFYWTKKDNQWRAQVVPLGEGMIDYGRYFKLIREYNISGPLSMHFEYPLGGAEHGAKTITMKKEEVLGAMKRDVVTLRRLLQESGLDD
jgi:sugar phosphate isomerase/epimerase